MKNLVLYLFELKLRVSFNSTLNCINKNSGITKKILKKNFKLRPK